MYSINYIKDKCLENKMISSELDLIIKAYDLACQIHDLEIRRNNEPLIDHLVNVAGIVTDLNADGVTIISALLHESINYGIEIKEIEAEFGTEIANIVNNLNKINKLKLTDYYDSASNYLRKILVGISEDVRVIIIKLADRLHDLRTGDSLAVEEQKILAKDTFEVLIPIAHRLGIYTIKNELEDWYLKYTKKDIYDEILEKLTGTKNELAFSLEEMKAEICKILSDHAISFQIKSRVKSVYSIYNKLNSGKKWNEIYDILAMRIIVQSETDCYLVLGLIHSKFHPIQNRFKDYIAMPKNNMYQSLHTTVFGLDGYVFEIQIRTKKMDELAEHGVASHWSYKEHFTANVQNFMEQKLELFRNTIQFNQSDNPEDVFMKNMEAELLSNLIYIYTPKGDVVELPSGSTPIDFAYRIHSKVGDQTIGAIVNDNIVPLSHELEDGDIVKINTSNNATPNKEWLNFVKTTQARSKIKSYFSKKDHEEYILRGKNLLEKEIRKQKLTISNILSEDNINKILKELKITNYDDLLLNIGSLRYTANYILSLINDNKKNIQDVLLERVRRNVSKSDNNYKNEVKVKGIDNILITMAKCCSPIPGDSIIGYITKGEGINVHKKDCPNISNLTSRLINVEWNNDFNDKLFNTRLLIKTNNLKNEILAIVTKASVRNIYLTEIKEYHNQDGIDYELEVKIKSIQELNQFINDLKNLSFIMEIKRL